jgi:outer membrane lipoprotein-sorting protein
MSARQWIAGAGVLAAFCLVPLSVHAQTVRESAAGRALAASQRQLADLTAEFSLEIAGAGQDGRDLEAHGHVWLGSGRRYRVEYDRPEVQVLVSDGKQRWLYLKQINQVQRQPLPPAGSSNELFLELGGGLPAVLAQCWVERLADEGASQVYDLMPQAGSGLDFSSARLWVSGPLRLPRRIMIEGARRVNVEFIAPKAHTRAELARRPGAGVPAERFRFTPPPNAEVVEPIVTTP